MSEIEYTPSVFNPKYRKCPYLDTINRPMLDFDFEKLCSISLTRINVYACLVCGKYFQGRGTNTHAYTHSVCESHHVFINLQTLRFYCLPDNYEIIDSSLDDIKYVLNPTFSSLEIKNIDKKLEKFSRTVVGTTYIPGIVGLNNIKANDYCNVILHALSHVGPLRDYFLDEENYNKIKRPPGDSIFTLVQRFGELMRKMWNPKNFKSHVSPHEMLQAVVSWSNKKFQITEQGDPVEFLSWFLHTLHKALRGKKSNDYSIIYKNFLGQMKIYTRKMPPVELDETQKSLLLATEEYQEKAETSKFLYLTCDLPPPPLFTDEFRENIIPQVSLYQLLSKFNGVAEKEYKTYKDNFMKKFEITKLPQFIILYIKRFTKNTFYLEKNPTIVNFPIRNIDFGDILTPENKKKHKYTKYNLIANIVHDGEPKKGTYRVHLFHKPNSQWYEMQDLHVNEILPQMITLTESYIQIYELNNSP
ncbi:U4/U6.U5 tri-snRNP-associated protein 2 [Condylostylus longicornis]|uniref:U4/U6.U5 tri-snRNP-associated protein 2 n=1 Tax=Condylostylus longicornis TaxID=2530218 RepID=UPI00244DECA4|nr:U4/U6.U5 tri-snRNP-associated protein 2 [Condylostylus longicornis]